MGQRAILLCKIRNDAFQGQPRASRRPPYQFTALEFTEPGTRVFFGPRSDPGLNIQGGGGEGEKQRTTGLLLPPRGALPRLPARLLPPIRKASRRLAPRGGGGSAQPGTPRWPRWGQEESGGLQRAFCPFVCARLPARSPATRKGWAVPRSPRTDDRMVPRGGRREGGRDKRSQGKDTWPPCHLIRGSAWGRGGQGALPGLPVLCHAAGPAGAELCMYLTRVMRVVCARWAEPP